MRPVLLPAIALLGMAISLGCSKPKPIITPEAPKTKTMNQTLDICGNKTIQNPSETDIRQAISGLDTKKGDAFLVLGPNDMTYIQTSGDPKVGFDLEYQEGDKKHHYRAKRDLTADEIVKALMLYSTGSDDWKKGIDWELIRL